jgi:hypothetical protein
MKLKKNIKLLTQKAINEQFNNDKQALINSLVSLVSERLIIYEDETTKFQHLNFNVEEHLKTFFDSVIELILNQEQDLIFERELRKQFSMLIGGLFEVLSESYSNKKEGANEYLCNNLDNILVELIGEEATEVVYSLNKDYLDYLIEVSIDVYHFEKKKKQNQGSNDNQQQINIVKYNCF